METHPLSSLAEAPEPATGNHFSILLNVVLVAAATVAVITPFCPLFAWIITKSTESAGRGMSSNTMMAAVLNAVLWILFTTSAMKTDDCLELVVAYPIMLTTSYIYLMIIYGNNRNFWQVIKLNIIVLPALVYVFVAVRFSISLSEHWQFFVGMAGIGILIWSHACLIMDLMKIKAFLDFALGFVNVFPNTAVNAATLFLMLHNHYNHRIILGCCGVGTGFGLCELMILTQLALSKYKARHGQQDDDHPDDENNPAAHAIDGAHNDGTVNDDARNDGATNGNPSSSERENDGTVNNDAHNDGATNNDDDDLESGRSSRVARAAGAIDQTSVAKRLDTNLGVTLSTTEIMKALEVEKSYKNGRRCHIMPTANDENGINFERSLMNDEQDDASCSEIPEDKKLPKKKEAIVTMGTTEPLKSPVEKSYKNGRRSLLNDEQDDADRSEIPEDKKLPKKKEAMKRKVPVVKSAMKIFCKPKPGWGGTSSSGSVAAH